MRNSFDSKHIDILQMAFQIADGMDLTSLKRTILLAAQKSL